MKLAFFLSVIFISSLYAQQTSLRSPFVSANVGIYDIAADQFAEQYNSSIGFLPSVSAGLPITTRMYLYGKVSYFVKNGVPITYNYKIQNGKLVLVSETKEGGTAKFMEWIINSGLLYNVFLSKEYTLGINAGIMGAIVNENAKDQTGSLRYNGGDVNAGLFLGAIIERNFDSIHFSLIGEAQYDFTNWKGTSSTARYGGLNISVGGRFYFHDRRIE